MPSENTITITMNPKAERHAQRITKRARAAGVEIQTYTDRDGNTRDRLSPVVHLALAFTAEHYGRVTEPAKAPTSDDAARLRAAMEARSIGPRGVAREADISHHSTVSHVLAGRLALSKAGGGALLAWVEGVEAGR